jgi:putative DNA primase/helicase
LAFPITSANDLRDPNEKESLLTQVLADTGNSHRFLARHRDDVRYCHAFKSWYVWDEKCWREDDQGKAVSLAKHVMIEFLTEATSAHHSELEKFAKRSLDVSKIKGLLTLAQDEVPIRPQDFDCHPDLLVFNNGTLDLRTGELRGFDRNHFIRKRVHHNYRAEAACPTFIRVLRHLMGSESDPERADRLGAVLQVYFGYSLTGHTSAKTAFILIGPKDTGKTTLLELFRELLAEHSATIRIETLMEGPGLRNLGLLSDLATLHGARFARTSETEEGKRLSESQLKQITQGMGTIRAEQKFRDPFNFRETHKLWIDANHKPVIRGVDSSIWDRLITIPFDVVVPEDQKDPQLLEKLLGESEGIFAWAAEGARRWYAEQRRLPRPEEFVSAGQAYRADMDTVGRFLEECCEIDPSASVQSSDIYGAYRKWSEKGGEHPMTQKSFSVRMKNRAGIETIHKEKGTFFDGVRVRPASTNPIEHD